MRGELTVFSRHVMRSDKQSDLGTGDAIIALTYKKAQGTARRHLDNGGRGECDTREMGDTIQTDNVVKSMNVGRTQIVVGEGVKAGSFVTSMVSMRSA